jgi:hypothetical protein
VTFLPAETFYFANGHAFDPDLGEGVFNFLEFEGLYDCFYFLPGCFLGAVFPNCGAELLDQREPG